VTIAVEVPDRHGIRHLAHSKAGRRPKAGGVCVQEDRHSVVDAARHGEVEIGGAEKDRFRDGAAMQLTTAAEARGGSSLLCQNFGRR